MSAPMRICRTQGLRKLAANTWPSEGDRLVGFRHQAQHAAGLLQIVPWVRTVRFKGSDGETGLFTLRDRGGCTKRLTELVQDLRDKDLVQQGTIGTAPAILVPARESLQVMTAALTSNPERNLCHSTACHVIDVVSWKGD